MTLSPPPVPTAVGRDDSGRGDAVGLMTQIGGKHASQLNGARLGPIWRLLLHEKLSLNLPRRLPSATDLKNGHADS